MAVSQPAVTDVTIEVSAMIRQRSIEHGFTGDVVEVSLAPIGTAGGIGESAPGR
jgi:hypothetical protein